MASPWRGWNGVERGWNALGVPDREVWRHLEVSDVRQRVDDLAEYWPDELADDWAHAETWAGEDWADPGMAHVLREALHEDYSHADAEAYDDALEAVLDGMSAAEAFSFGTALRQIERGASQAVANPIVGQIAQTALPVGAGALGTLIGGPAGTALGSRLGTLAAGALARPGQPGKVTGAAGTSPAASPAPAVAGGSAAAAQGLVLTQLPDVLKALLALSMGQHGARSVNGVPVASVMNMLSSVFGQAAADADELAYLDGEDAEGSAGFDENFGEGEAYAEPSLGTGRTLYTALMDAENEELAS